MPRKRGPSTVGIANVGIATAALVRRHERALRELARRRAETLPNVFEAVCDYVEREWQYAKAGLYPAPPDLLIAALKEYAGKRAEVDEPPWIARLRQLVARYEAEKIRLAKRAERVEPRPRPPASGDWFTLK